MKFKFIVFGQVLTAFLLFYLGPNYLATFREGLHKFYFDFELTIPLIPWMIIPYASVYFSPLILLFYSSENYAYRARFALLAQIFIALFFFLVFPAQLGFTRFVPEGFFSYCYRLIFALDQPHNLLPSLHVGFAFEWSLGIREINKKWGPVILFWYILVCISVVTTHQHHIPDILTGMPMAYLCHQWARRYYLKNPVPVLVKQ